MRLTDELDVWYEEKGEFDEQSFFLSEQMGRRWNH